MEKSNFLHFCKALKLRMLFAATIIALVLSANIGHCDILVDLVYIDTAQYPTIRAYVRVIDENGNPITDLTVSHFSIFEDGNAQTPLSATLFPSPIDPIEETTSYAASQGSLGSVVVASDGRDNASSLSLDNVISLAASNGIPIFTVGLGDVNVEVVLRMAEETNGSYFYAPTPSDLETVYFTNVTQHVGGYIVSYETSATGCQDHILEIGVTDNTGEGNDSGSVTICPQSSGGSDGRYYVVRSGGSGGGCFITTAAYGSRMAKEVKVF